MLRPRIIPVLLLDNNALVKTTRFQNPKYIGDPINAVRIFNEKKADELILLDINATAKFKKPNFDLISKIVSESRMPFCYGGGVSDIEEVISLVNIGVEKIALNSGLFDNPKLVGESAHKFGSQSVAVVIDVKKTGFLRKNFQVFKTHGTVNTQLNPFEFAKQLEDQGAGEIVLQSIDNDGLLTGYDLELIEQMHSSVNIPITVIGGAGSYEDFRKLINKFKIIGIGAGSVFVFKGKYRAVLIQYPEKVEKNKIYFND